MSDPDELDLLLDAWARQHRLSADRRDAIRRTIVTPTTLSVEWWQSFTSQMADIVVRATQPPVVSAPGLSVYSR